jgi:GT2 family glycosyltransferase
MTKIVNIVVCFKNEIEVSNYAKELSMQSIASNIVLVVVVNMESDIGNEFLKNKLENVALNSVIIHPKTNLGYMNGLLYGYRQYTEMTGTVPRWVIMSNTDIHYWSNASLDNLLNAEYGDEVACIAPSIYLPSRKTYLNPQYMTRINRKKINRLIRVFKYNYLSRLYKLLYELKDSLSNHKEITKTQYVYSAHGCFFILSGKFTESIKDIEHPALMYNEEIFIAENIYHSEKKCLYDPSLKVIHTGAAVIGKIGHEKRSQHLLDGLKAIRSLYFNK